MAENTKTKADIFELAEAFLCIEAMTPLKLQLLCYYAKAWYLALYGENIIEEHFEAWVHGAASPKLHEKYKEYGLFEDIPKKENSEGISKELLSFAEEVFEAYGHLSGYELEKINHQEDPWLNAREDCKPWQHSRKAISEEDIRMFYKKMTKTTI